MRKALLILGMMFAANATVLAQQKLFMEILENKKICNKEDELTWFLQTHSFERQNENHYVHQYASEGGFYNTTIINQNECYLVYRTDNKKDYDKIYAAVTAKCSQEMSASKKVSCICNTGRIKDVQVMFNGFSQASGNYEIMVYQNPGLHEMPYNQADRKEVSSK